MTLFDMSVEKKLSKMAGKRFFSGKTDKKRKLDGFAEKGRKIRLKPGFCDQKFKRGTEINRWQVSGSCWLIF
jgi:hypothetical protein